jgi:hypothetical protein
MKTAAASPAAAAGAAAADTAIQQQLQQLFMAFARAQTAAVLPEAKFVNSDHNTSSNVVYS